MQVMYVLLVQQLQTQEQELSMILTFHWSVVYVLKVIDVLLDHTTLCLVLKVLIKIRLVRAYVSYALLVSIAINLQSRMLKLL